MNKAIKEITNLVQVEKRWLEEYKQTTPIIEDVINPSFAALEVLKSFSSYVPVANAGPTDSFLSAARF